MANTTERKLNHTKYYALNLLMGRPCDINNKTQGGRVLIWLRGYLWTEPEKERKKSATILTKQAKILGAADYLRFCKLENIVIENRYGYYGVTCFYIKSI